MSKVSRRRFTRTIFGAATFGVVAMAGLFLAGSQQLEAAADGKALASTPQALQSDNQVLVFGGANCGYCGHIRTALKPEYDKSVHAKDWPMHFVGDASPADVGLSGSDDIMVEPTFVFVSKGREINRFPGYPGVSNFFVIMSRITGQGQSTLR